MQGDHIAVAPREEIAERQPAGTALAIAAGREAAPLQHAQKILHALAIEPEYGDGCVKVGEETTRPEVLLFRRPAQRHNDPLQVAHLFQRGDDLMHSGRLKLRVEGRQHQPDGPVARESFQLGLEPVNVITLQAVQGGDNSGLMKISHMRKVDDLRKRQGRRS